MMLIVIVKVSKQEHMQIDIWEKTHLKKQMIRVWVTFKETYLQFLTAIFTKRTVGTGKLSNKLSKMSETGK